MKAILHRLGDSAQPRPHPVADEPMTPSRVVRTSRLGGGLVVLLALAHVANDAITSMLAALLPTLQQRFSMSEAMLAMIVAVFSFSSAVTQPLFGALSDRVGRRMLAVIGLVLSVALLSLMAVAPSVPALFALLIIGGLGSAAFHPTGTSIARMAGPNKELAVGMFSAGGMIRLAIGPLAAIAVTASLGVSYTPWLMVPGLLLGVAINLKAPVSRPLPSLERARFFDWSLLRGPVGGLLATGVLMEIAFVTFSSGFPLWLVAERSIARDSSIIGWTLAAFYVAAAVGGAAAGYISKRVSQRKLIVTSLLLAPLPLFGAFVAEAGSLSYFAAVALAGILVNAPFPLLIVAAQERAPRSEATASGILMGLSVGIAGVLYVGIGWLQQIIGFTAAMSIGYLMLIPAALVSLRAMMSTGTTPRSARKAATLDRPTHPYRRVYTKTKGHHRWN